MKVAIQGEESASPDDSPTPRRGPWGLLATIAFGVLAIGLSFIAQLLLAIPYLVVRFASAPERDIEALVGGLENDGFFLALSGSVVAPFSIGFVLLLVWLRKGPSVRDYLALHHVSWRTTLRWLLFTAALLVLLDVAAVVTGHAVVPDWMIAIYGSAVSVPLLVLALALAAPAVEEVLFRGFLFEGMRHSFLGTPGTVVLTSVAWASLHLQYEWFYMLQILILGLLLGAARAATGSVVPVVLMHAFVNCVALVQTALES